MASKKLEEITQRLREMRLPVMASQLISLYESGELKHSSTEDILDMLTLEEYISRKNNTVERYRKSANLSQMYAELSEIHYTPERKINERVLEQLSRGEYINKARNVLIVGACGTGKTYIANALASDACRKLHRTVYCRMFELISDVSRWEQQKIKNRYVKPDVLVIDDFGNTRLSEQEALQLFKVMEYRYGSKSTIIASQLEPEEWHQNFGASLLADSILDRTISNSYKIILSGESLRPKTVID